MSVPDNMPAAESRKPVRLMVVGDSDFASDEYLQMARYLPFYQGGAQMLFNAISWTMEDEALTPVRSKTVAARPINVGSDGAVLALKVVNIVGVAVALHRLRRRPDGRPAHAPARSEAMNKKTLIAARGLRGPGHHRPRHAPPAREGGARRAITRGPSRR